MGRMENLERQASQRLERAIHQGKYLAREDSLATAVHETAHALSGEAFGLTLKNITCTRHYDGDELLLGAADFEDGEVILPGIIHHIHNFIGDIAEEPYTNSGDIISGSDSEKMRELIQQTQWKQTGDQFLGMRDATRHVAKQLDKWIRPVAARLYGHRTMSGEEVRAQLRQMNFYQKNEVVDFGIAASIYAFQINTDASARARLLSESNQRYSRADFAEALSRIRTSALKQLSIAA